MRGRTRSIRRILRKFPVGPNPPGSISGGPLKIPHVYDGTDKTFFYVNLERQLVAQSGGFVRDRADAGGTKRRFQRGQRADLRSAVESDRPANADVKRGLRAGRGQRARHVHSHRIDQPAGHQFAELHSATPNIPVTSIAGQNFNYHLQTNLPGLSNRLNVNVTHQISVEAERAGELQPEQRHIALAEQFSGDRGKHVHARAERRCSA